MFYTKITDDMFQAIEDDIKAFLKANFDQLYIERVSIGGQFLSNNIFFSDVRTSHGAVVLDFIECFYNILDKYGCYTNWDVCLHGHYASISERGVLKGAEFRCIHYRLDELSPNGDPTKNVKYLGHMNAIEFSADQLKRINKTLFSKHKSLLNQMR